MESIILFLGLLAAFLFIVRLYDDHLRGQDRRKRERKVIRRRFNDEMYRLYNDRQGGSR